MEEVLKKIKKIKDLDETSQTEVMQDINKKSEIQRLYDINNTLLDIAEKELETRKVPSKEVLDTIQMALIISAALPWSKYNL